MINIYLMIIFLTGRRVSILSHKLSADIKMKIYKIKTSFLDPKGPHARANKTGINLILIFAIVEKFYIKTELTHCNF